MRIEVRERREWTEQDGQLASEVQGTRWTRHEGDDGWTLLGASDESGDLHLAESRRIADEAIAVLRLHDQAEHDGEVCSDERTNMLAYIAHRIGMVPSEEAVRDVLERARDYQAIHDEYHDDSHTHDQEER